MSFYWDAQDFANGDSQQYAVLFSVYGTEDNDTGEAMNEEMIAAYHLVTWTNYDDSVLLQQYVKETDVPQYTGLTPVRPLDSDYSYTFSGWSPEPSPPDAGHRIQGAVQRRGAALQGTHPDAQRKHRSQLLPQPQPHRRRRHR